MITSMQNGGFFMGQNEEMFEKENISTLLFKLSIPIIISMLVSELYNMVDTVFVGNFVDPNGIGALAIVFPIQRIIIALSIMIGIGSSTAFTRARGAHDLEDARKVISNGFTLVFMVMVPISILIHYFAEPILIGLGASGIILTYSVEYLSTIILSSTFLSWTIFTSNIMISLGKSKIAILSTSIGAILNVIIDYILVKKLSMGVGGAAIATAASQFAGFLFSYYHLFQLKQNYNIKKGFAFNKNIIISILLVGFSAFIVEAEDGILMGILNNLLSVYANGDSIVILALITKVYMFLFITMFGISSAMQPIAAYNVGAKKYKRLKTVLKKTMIFGFITTLILWIISMVFTAQILRIFVDDPVIISKSVKAFRIIALFFPLISFYYISIFYYQSLGVVKRAFAMSILRQIVIMIPLSIILVKYLNFGAMGVWLSFPITDIFVSLIAMVSLSVEIKKLNKLI